MGDLPPLAVAGPGDDLAVDGGGQVIRGAQIVAVVVGVQLALVVQQAGGAVLNALDHNAQTGLVAVHIAVIQAVDLVLHQGLASLAGEVHHKLLDNSAGLLHVAAGGLVLVAVAIAVVAIVPVARVAVGHQGGGHHGVGGSLHGVDGVGLSRTGAGVIGIAVPIVVAVVAVDMSVAVVPIVVAVPLVVDAGVGLLRVRLFRLFRLLGIGILAGIGHVGRGVFRRLHRAHVMIPVAVLGNDPGLLHQSAQAVVGVNALLAVAVDAPDHLVGFVEGVGPGGGELLVLAVLLQNQVAPLVVGAGRVRLPVVGGAVDLLIQISAIVILIILIC